MLKFGIFIPEEPPSWELDPDNQEL